jgi:hypothetical protein
VLDSTPHSPLREHQDSHQLSPRLREQIIRAVAAILVEDLEEFPDIDDRTEADSR